MRSISDEHLRAFRDWGRKGGKARAQKLSPLERQAISRRAAQRRWSRGGAAETLTQSARLEEARWDDPVYLEEVLSHGSLNEWKELYHRLAEHPFGPEAVALQRVFDATHVYGASILWKGFLRCLQGHGG